MKKKLFIFTIFITLTLAFPACNLITIEIDNGGSSEDQVITIQEDQTSTVQQQTETSSYLLPKYILVDTGDEESLTYVDLQGQTIAVMQTPGIGYGSASQVHVAGSSTLGVNNIPLVYHSFTNPESLLVNSNNSISSLVDTPMFYGLAGAPGEAIIAYSVYEPTSESVHSDLYLGTLETLPTTGPIHSTDDKDSYRVMNPLAISTESGIATGIWYTFSAWGIGGDIIFPVNQSLFYFDMTSGNNYEFIGDSCNVQGLSQDFTWAACRGSTSDGSPTYTIENFVPGNSVSFPLDPSSDRGAGYGTFSPDGLYVAWLEASGSNMAEVPNYHSRIRIGMTSGGIIYDQDDTALSQALGGGTIPYMQPVGWLDTHNVLVEAYLDNYLIASLIRINIVDGSITKIAEGTFIAFVY